MLTKYEELCTPTIPFLSIIYERPKEMLNVVISIDGVIGLLYFLCIIYSFFLPHKISSLNVYCFKKKIPQMTKTFMGYLSVSGAWSLADFAGGALIHSVPLAAVFPLCSFQDTISLCVFCDLSLSVVCKCFCCCLAHAQCLALDFSCSMSPSDPFRALASQEFPSCRGAGRSPLTPPTLFAS